MNVAIFASAFYPHVGGVEELCRQLAHEYRRRGLGVIVVTNRWPTDLPAEEHYEGIPVYRLSMRTPEGSAKQRVKHGLTHPLVRRRLYGILRRHAVDLIHVQCVSVNGYYALLAHRDLKVPLVVTAQGERTMDAGRLYERSAYMNGVLQALLAEAQWVTACSRDTLGDIERYCGKSLTGRSSVVYNGIQLADFDGPMPDPPHVRPYVLGIGRLVPQKGFDVLIRAYAEAQLPGHDLVLAGEGPERARLEAVAREARVAERVRFFGRADRAAAMSLFRHCELFALPSRQEPMGIVNLEAMAAGKAVVASRVGGVPELVLDGETGMLVPPEDVGAMGGELRRLTVDPVLRARLGAAGRTRAERFDWPSIAQQYLDIYTAAGAGGGMMRIEPSVATCPAPVSAAHRPAERTSVSQVWRGAMMRVRLAWARMRHPRARLGARCDVRRRVCLRMAAGARVEFGEGCVLDNDLTVECSGTLRVGSGTIFGHHCTVAARAAVEIGKDCMIAELVSIRDHDHCFDRLDVPYREQGMVTSPVRIGRNVWLGAKVTVAKGVTIGDNVVIGANAVVTKDVPANAIAVGVPARVIKMREA